MRLSGLDIRLYNAGLDRVLWRHRHGMANYRQAYGMFVCTGILSNHYSLLRPKRFVTREIVNAVAALSLGRDVRLSLDNLHIETDWGWAPGYVEAIAAMSEQSVPTDFIIATGSSHTLQEFMETVFELVGKNWRDTSRSNLMRPTDTCETKSTHRGPQSASVGEPRAA